MTTEIASAKPLNELTPAEKKARWRELSKKARFQDQTAVTGEPGVHYFWADKNDDPELIRLDTLGYWVVKEPDPAGVKAGNVKPKIVAAGLRDDGTYVRGDVILMACSQEDYEFFILDIEQRHDEAMTGIPEEFRDSAERLGAPVFTVSK